MSKYIIVSMVVYCFQLPSQRIEAINIVHQISSLMKRVLNVVFFFFKTFLSVTAFSVDEFDILKLISDTQDKCKALTLIGFVYVSNVHLVLSYFLKREFCLFHLLLEIVTLLYMI